ncbi:hypothetical protein DICPUDRAFT_156071 [Dictyostelium purpureum]|uniref:Uncharacterized protein n=1 Tax=Dictyostelium purpureum TaxID=5786 RepID=F0ZVM3_DICPU|nr:uncharacterized protein DICPUDRAFT_156071 [Dictyostelium purpureum]EGC32015.1 hypothetical protein DICPUDRAFT_156071 [Dictyostelium purpureum]|eukprot:XP_003291471.1 hypothetical protein DICPUDRAFT_156071 [Dictyostelium purpureum]
MNINDNEQIVNLLLILIGLPACGKTTFSKTLIEYLYSNKINLIDNNNLTSNIDQQINIYHLEYDEIFKLICKKIDNNNSLENWKPTRLEVYSQILNIINNKNNKLILLNQILPIKSYKLSNNIDNNNNNSIDNINKSKTIINLIILDDNMYYKSMRYKYYQLSNSFQNVKYCQIYFKKDIYKSIENNNNRTINNQNHNNFKNINYHSDQDEMVFLLSKEKERNITKNNIIHQFDLQCRKIISDIMKSKTKSSGCNSSVNTPYSNVSKVLSQYKQTFLKTTLTGFIQDNHDYIQEYSDIIPPPHIKIAF